ncbi:hybrid sensor histidine kinase/response regulator [Maridesulfovibrio zosterae]|uniref:hybrid sensor histidine kinase/response regulator n=1 Tax=Maridesulfovibrio zosterae TaxID=82171 RepID=UPI00041D1437|nr:hybrid sensor histidine kinase/response regulator [Maridesulfovibrio zosterae]
MHCRINPLFIIAFSFFLIFISIPYTAFAFQQDLRFQKFPLNERLSQSSLLCMIQDSKGFMWFGTYDGLNRYDGQNIKIYKPSKKPGSISDGNIRALYEDSKGQLWVGTGNGLNFYDRKTDTFKSYLPEKDNPDSISGKNIRCIYEDSKGRMWIGTHHGLNLFDRSSGKFKKFQASNSTASISHNEIRSIHEDMQGHIWVGTAVGLNLLLDDGKKFKKYRNDPANPSSICDDTILCFYQNKKNELWIGTKKGISIYNPTSDNFETLFRSLEINDIYEDNKGTLWLGTLEGLAKRSAETASLSPEKMHFTFFTKNQMDPQSIGDNKIIKILEDRSGVLWIGTYGDGLSLLTPKMQAFGIKSRHPWKKNTLPGMEVSAVLEDSQGEVWIGTYKNGLSIYNPHTNIFRNYSKNSKKPWNLSGNRINCIFEDSNGLFWVGTRKNGVFVIDKNKGIVSRYRRNKKDPETLSQNNVWWIYQGSKGYIWIGTSKKGLNRLDPKTGKIKLFSHSDKDPTSLGHNRVRNIFEDSHHNFWVCTNAGLNLMDRTNGTFKHYKHDPENPNTISNNRVTPIAEAADGSLWIGTDQGLNRFDPVTETFTRFTKENRLANDGIQGLCIDNSGKIWVSTFKGISTLEPTTGKIWNFGLSDGLQGIEYWINSYNKGQSGKMYFGGLKGMNMFDPRDIKINHVPPPVVITNLTIMNTPVNLGTNISETKEITLSWKDAMFTFSFAALDYQNPKLNKYKYKLEGFNDRWIDAISDASATFTNFDHGTYTFKVIASNSDGVWNKIGTSIKVKIIPPFWNTWWFKSLVIFIILFSSLLFMQLRILAVQRQRESLARQVDKKTADLSHEIEEHMKTEQQLEDAIIKAEEANQAKSAFLASMSHEIRTPLNSIIGVADLLKGTEISDEQAEYVNIFESSSEILLSIINDILDFSKIEANHVKLESIHIDLLQEIESILSLQATAAIMRGIELVCRFKPDVPEFVIGDPTRLRQVLLNIVSNAVKFTSHGEVSMTVARSSNPNKSDDIIFTIADTGVGIDPEKLESIFAPFSQADSSTTRRFGGSGLGLSISKKLSELMGGNIKAESTPGVGSCFKVTLPLPRDLESSSSKQPSLDNTEIIVAVRNPNALNAICETLNSFGATTTPCFNAESLRVLLSAQSDYKHNILAYDMTFQKNKNLNLLENIQQSGVKLPPVLLMQQGVSFDRNLLQGMINAQGITMPPPKRTLLRTIMKMLAISPATIQDSSRNDLAQLPDIRVLLVEDNISNRELVRHFFKKTEATLIMATNGKEGLELALYEKYDIILIDMEMPVMDGYEFLSQFRKKEMETHDKRTGIIALTAHASSEFREKCLEAGADDFLPKPIKQAALLRTILALHNRIK